MWLISKLQPEYVEASNPETLPFGNFHILHIQMKRHTCTRTRTHAPGSWKFKQLRSRSSRRTRWLSSQLCTPNRIVKDPSCAILAVQHLNTDKFKTGRLFVPACTLELRRASGTTGEQKRGQKMWTAHLPAWSREASWPFEPFNTETPQPCSPCSGEEVQLIIVVRERLCLCF